MIACNLCPHCFRSTTPTVLWSCPWILHNQDLDISLNRLFITRDFNYSYLRPHLSSCISLQWVSFLSDQFYNALMIFMNLLLLGGIALLTLQLIISLSIRHFVLKLSKAIYISWMHHGLATHCSRPPAVLVPHLRVLVYGGETHFWLASLLINNAPRQHLDDIPLKIHFEWNAQKKWDFVKT
jgi:hypothetical protein